MIFVYCCNRVCNLFCKCTGRILVLTEMLMSTVSGPTLEDLLGRYRTLFDEEVHNCVVTE
jgi:hypothetical protein